MGCPALSVGGAPPEPAEGEARTESAALQSNRRESWRMFVSSESFPYEIAALHARRRRARTRRGTRRFDSIAGVRARTRFVLAALLGVAVTAILGSKLVPAVREPVGEVPPDGFPALRARAGYETS